MNFSEGMEIFPKSKPLCCLSTGNYMGNTLDCLVLLLVQLLSDCFQKIGNRAVLLKGQVNSEKL